MRPWVRLSKFSGLICSFLEFHESHPPVFRMTECEAHQYWQVCRRHGGNNAATKKHRPAFSPSPPPSACPLAFMPPPPKSHTGEGPASGTPILWYIELMLSADDVGT